MARRSKICVVMMMLAFAAVACNLSGDTGEPAAAPTIDVPAVDIRVPVNGMSYAQGTNVIIQAVGTDAGAGVSRIDLQVDDLPIGSSAAPNAAGQSAFIANFEWQAVGQGLHSVTAIAFRQDGTASTPAIINVNVTQARATLPPPPTDPPTQASVQEPPTDPPPPTAVPPSATPSGPRGVTNTGINVRSGPGTVYPTIGSLLSGTELELRGKNSDGTWWQVPYGFSLGWVFALYVDETGDLGSVPVVAAPPLPPTATPIPPTAVPPPPATPVPAGPSISFTSTVDESHSYAPGTCFSFFWTVTGVSGVYFNGEGVPGEGSREVCPGSTTTYHLFVEKTDGTTEDRAITATIN